MNVVAATGVGTIGLLSLEASETGIRATLKSPARTIDGLRASRQAKSIIRIDERLPQQALSQWDSRHVFMQTRLRRVGRRPYCETQGRGARTSQAAIDNELAWF